MAVKLHQNTQWKLEILIIILKSTSLKGGPKTRPLYLTAHIF